MLEKWSANLVAKVGVLLFSSVSRAQLSKFACVWSVDMLSGYPGYLPAWLSLIVPSLPYPPFHACM